MRPVPDVMPPLPPELMPRHVAVIMDGNGRWAKSRGLSRSEGHRAGMHALKNALELSGDWGIGAFTVYAFSTENWSRPPEEVAALMGLLVEFFRKEIDTMVRRGVKLRILGETDALPALQRQAIRRALRATQDCAGPTFCIALNYGGRAELARAARLLAQEAADGKRAPASIDEAALAEKLYTAGLPDVDLLIRTSGELRLSGFLPWQTTYAEFVIEPCLWPDFDEAAYRRALAQYGARKRRFGGI